MTSINQEHCHQATGLPLEKLNQKDTKRETKKTSPLPQPGFWTCFGNATQRCKMVLKLGAGIQVCVSMCILCHVVVAEVRSGIVMERSTTDRTAKIVFEKPGDGNCEIENWIGFGASDDDIPTSPPFLVANDELGYEVESVEWCLQDSGACNERVGCVFGSPPEDVVGFTDTALGYCSACSDGASYFCTSSSINHYILDSSIVISAEECSEIRTSSDRDGSLLSSPWFFPVGLLGAGLVSGAFYMGKRRSRDDNNNLDDA